MDFNIYDFLGNPPLPKKGQWCPHCREIVPYNEGWNMCVICGKSKDENNQEYDKKQYMPRIER